MKKLSYLFISFTLLLTTTFVTMGQTQKISLKKDSGEITWKGKKVTGKKHHGKISIKEGMLHVVDGELKDINVTIDMNSIDNQDIDSEKYRNKLEGHLKSDDFFHVKQYPESHFKSTSIVKSSKENKYYVEGNLTIKGQTHPIEFSAFFNAEENNYKAEAELTFDRSKYNVRYGSDSFFDNLGDDMIYNDIDLEINLQGAIN